MAFKLTIGGAQYQFLAYSVTEASSPISAGDSSGQVGTISFTLPAPDREITPNHPLIIYGDSYLVGKDVRLDDSRKGFTLGRVDSVQVSRESGNIQVSCTSRLGKLNVYNVQTPPFVGTLAEAFENYLALAGVTTDLYVDPSIAPLQVTVPGWTGELWYHLKQFAAAQGCDITLVSGVILLRPLRAREAVRGRDISRSYTVGGGSLAQNIVVNQYNNRPITNSLVYPPGGWSEEVSTINVNAGETIEQSLELSASVWSVQQPVMQTFVSPTFRTSSVYTVTGDDGLPIDPNEWRNRGGSLTVSINPDTVSLTVKVTAPRGIPNKDGKLIGVYSIARSDENGTGRYSTLRIVGSGVAFSKEEVRVPTGITEQETGTDVGATIDNPFLSTRDEVYSAAAWAVRGYNGTEAKLSGSVTAFNRRGDTGELTLRTYAELQTLHQGQTNSDIQGAFAGQSYLQVQEDFNSGSDDDFENQVFGNVAGARVWDEKSRRWYRVRSGTQTQDNIQFEADDDLMHRDVRNYFGGLTYDNNQVMYNGFSYREVDLMGLRPDYQAPPPPPTLYPASDLFPSPSLSPAGV